mmetsp:Transcript_5642/g.15841  ORF Transcript_5642/g.15841 Transcript_5642/m.15841 type:complete len:235 (+) Transcript_5642:240-944(+)
MSCPAARRRTRQSRHRRPARRGEQSRTTLRGHALRLSPIHRRRHQPRRLPPLPRSAQRNVRGHPRRKGHAGLQGPVRRSRTGADGGGSHLLQTGTRPGQESHVRRCRQRQGPRPGRFLRHRRPEGVRCRRRRCVRDGLLPGTFGFRSAPIVGPVPGMHLREGGELPKRRALHGRDRQDASRGRSAFRRIPPRVAPSPVRGGCLAVIVRRGRLRRGAGGRDAQWSGGGDRPREGG